MYTKTYTGAAVNLIKNAIVHHKWFHFAFYRLQIQITEKGFFYKKNPVSYFKILTTDQSPLHKSAKKHNGLNS